MLKFLVFDAMGGEWSTPPTNAQLSASSAIYRFMGKDIRVPASLVYPNPESDESLQQVLLRMNVPTSLLNTMRDYEAEIKNPEGTARATRENYNNMPQEDVLADILRRLENIETALRALMGE